MAMQRSASSCHLATQSKQDLHNTIAILASCRAWPLQKASNNVISLITFRVISVPAHSKRSGKYKELTEMPSLHADYKLAVPVLVLKRTTSHKCRTPLYVPKKSSFVRMDQASVYDIQPAQENA